VENLTRSFLTAWMVAPSAVSLKYDARIGNLCRVICVYELQVSRRWGEAIRQVRRILSLQEEIMRKVTTLLLASTLVLGTTAAFSQINVGVGSNAGGAANIGSGAASGSANVRGSAGVNKGSANAGANVGVGASSSSGRHKNRPSSAETTGSGTANVQTQIRGPSTSLDAVGRIRGGMDMR
jgi:hypothetical protein